MRTLFSMTQRASAILMLATLALAGCETETRVISTRGSLLMGQPGAEGGVFAERPLDAKGPTAAERMNNPMGYRTPGDMDPATLRVKDARGKEFIVSRNPRELFFHLRRALVDKDSDLLLEQILSRETIATYQELGRDPREAADFIVEHREEINRLLQFFPMADMTPGFFPKNIGRNQFRLEAPPGFANPPLKFRTIDYMYERDACRLLLIH